MEQAFEEISFRNLVLFYREELKDIEKNSQKLTSNRRLSFQKHGVICVSRIGKPINGSRYELTQRAKKILEEIRDE